MHRVLHHNVLEKEIKSPGQVSNLPGPGILDGILKTGDCKRSAVPLFGRKAAQLRQDESLVNLKRFVEGSVSGRLGDNAAGCGIWKTAIDLEPYVGDRSVFKREPHLHEGGLALDASRADAVGVLDLADIER